MLVSQRAFLLYPVPIARKEMFGYLFWQFDGFIYPCVAVAMEDIFTVSIIAYMMYDAIGCIFLQGIRFVFCHRCHVTLCEIGVSVLVLLVDMFFFGNVFFFPFLPVVLQFTPCIFPPSCLNLGLKCDDWRSIAIYFVAMDNGAAYEVALSSFHVRFVDVRAVAVSRESSCSRT